MRTSLRMLRYALAQGVLLSTVRNVLQETPWVLRNRKGISAKDMDGTTCSVTLGGCIIERQVEIPAVYSIKSFNHQTAITITLLIAISAMLV